MINKGVFKRVTKRLDELVEEMISLEQKLTALPAIAPENGGTGEWDKACFLREFISSLKLGEIREINAPDPRVPSGVRPNIIVTRPGRTADRTVWIVTHMDVVPSGPRTLWQKDPFSAWVENKRVYGRGTEDNQQDLVASIFALKACLDEGIEFPGNAGLVFVSDEETSSKYGLSYILGHKENPFRPQDIIVVPDSGNPQGTLIEIAEKSIFWLKFKTLGKQCHASVPHRGVNAFLAASHLAIELHKRLHEHFNLQNTLFHPAYSTFQPTKHEANVENVNTIPGEDTFYLDARVLPDYNLEEVKDFVLALVAQAESAFSVKIEVEEVQRLQAPPPTKADAPVVSALSQAVYDVYGVKAKPQGIGAGTVAAYLRRLGYSVAVWCRSDNTAHQPNEYALIENIVGDAKVFAHLFLQEYNYSKKTGGVPEIRK